MTPITTALSRTMSTLGEYLTYLRYHSALTPLLFCLFLYFGWRLWRFTLYKQFYPEEPKTYPYLVPFLGHSISFFRDVEGTLTKARLYFQNKRDPFKLTIMGQSLYVFTSANDPARIYKNENLSLNPWLIDMMHQFGASDTSVQAMWSTMPNAADHKPGSPHIELHKWEDKPIKEVCLMLFRQFLNPGDHLDTLLDVLLGSIYQRMSWNAIPEDIIYQKDSQDCTISLAKWAQEVLLEGATKSFFGDTLLKIEPQLLDSFAMFDETSWKMSYRIPEIFAEDCKKSKAIGERALGQFFDLPIEQRPDTSLVIREVEKVLRVAGIGSEDMGILVLMFFWVINANAWKAGFWMLVHIIKNPSLRSTILEEISPYVSPTTSLESVELANKLQSCPVFMSAYHETLRIASSSMTIRYVMEESYVRGFKLEKDAKVMIPYRQVMLDESIYGHNSEEYNHEQFLKNPALLKTPNYKPFGGGVSLCPGRILAQKEVLTFVALALGKFGARLPENNQAGVGALPKMQTRKPCLGIMGPEAGEDVAVTVTKPQY